MSEESEFEEMMSIKQAEESLDDAQLIDFILKRFHERHRFQLDNLIALARKVEQVHKEHDQCPEGLALYLSHMSAELEQHMYKEENILFPMIKSGQGSMTVGPISVMKHEHEEHYASIKTLESKAYNLILPEQACETWKALYSELKAFISDLNAHIELENNVLFARQ